MRHFNAAGGLWGIIVMTMFTIAAIADICESWRERGSWGYYVIALYGTMIAIVVSGASVSTREPLSFVLLAAIVVVPTLFNVFHNHFLVRSK